MARAAKPNGAKRAPAVAARFGKPITASDAEVAVFYFLMSKGRIVTGMTMQNWKTKTMKDLQVDDPPLANDPTLDARMLATDLQGWMLAWGMKVANATAIFSNQTKTVQDLIDFVVSNSQPAGTL